MFGKLVFDWESKNKDVIVELAERYGIKRVVVSAYYPQANKIIEHSHKSIVNTLLKMFFGGFINWIQNLSAVLWANQLTVYTSPGLTFYYIGCGSKLVFFIELEIFTWRILP